VTDWFYFSECLTGFFLWESDQPPPLWVSKLTPI
jgi:hypothetical protein